MRRTYRNQESSGLKTNVHFLFLLYTAGCFILTGALFYYQVLNGDYYLERAKNNYVRLVPLRAIRGSIYDRRGEALAFDKATFNISVIPYQIYHQKDELFRELSAFLQIKTDVLYQNYNKNLHNIFSPVDIVLDIDKKTALALIQNFEDSLVITPQPKRYYPYAFEYSHIIGYVKEAASHYEKLKKYGYKPLERVGFLGLEQYYDAYLGGEDGGDLIEVDARGRIVGYLGQQSSKRGNNISLTIDSGVQTLAAQALGDRPGVIVLMDAANGSLISLCSSPSFSLNDFSEGKNISAYLTDTNSPLINRAIQSTYPLGSIFKPILALCALSEGKVTPYTPFVCNGKFELGHASFRCSGNHGEQDIFLALAHSCNVYFYNTGLLIGPEAIAGFARRFGLDSLTQVDLPYERKGTVPEPQWKRRVLKKTWFPGDTVNFSIGQGFLEATPLEATVAISVIANRGYLVTPHLIDKIENMSFGQATRTYLGVDEKYLDVVRKGMRDVVEIPSGTAHLLNQLPIAVSGKTGTAQARGEPHGWFVGFFPHNGRVYTICVFLEHGSSGHQAVETAYTFLEGVLNADLL